LVHKSDNDEDEEVLSRNHSSVVVNIELRDSAAGRPSKNFLTGGDAEVAIWERLWEKHEKSPSVLAYDLMQTPHHCSWHTLSYDSWSEKREKGEVDPGEGVFRVQLCDLDSQIHGRIPSLRGRSESFSEAFEKSGVTRIVFHVR
jgi:hypothetical protein